MESVPTRLLEVLDENRDAARGCRAAGAEKTFGIRAATAGAGGYLDDEDEEEPEENVDDNEDEEDDEDESYA